MRTDSGFLGSGIKFPIQIDQSTGRFSMSLGETSVRESVYIILMTGRGERWMVPEFGSDITSYTFMDISATMLNIMRNNLSRLLLEQEPRLSDVDINFDTDSRKGCLIIDIEYTVSDTNTKDNLVFPFYLQGVREEYADEPVEE